MDDVKDMKVIADDLRTKLEGGLPWMNIKNDSNLASSVAIYGSLDKREDWSNDIYQNSRHFILHVTAKGGRYYTGGEVTAEILSSGKISKKFRKYSGTPEKVIAKIVQWIHDLVEEN